MKGRGIMSNIVKQKRTVGARIYASGIQFRKNWPLLMLCLPTLIGMFLFAYVPMGGVVMAFKDYRIAKGIWGSEWNGFDNFKFIFATSDMWRIIRNTVLYSLASIFCKVIRKRKHFVDYHIQRFRNHNQRAPIGFTVFF